MASGGTAAAVPSLSSTSRRLLSGTGGATVPSLLSSTRCDGGDGMAALWPLSLSWLCRRSLRYQCVKTGCPCDSDVEKGEGEGEMVWARVRARVRERWRE